MKNLFLNVCQDPQGRIWGVARVCLADGSCLVLESRMYRERPRLGEDALAGEDEDAEPPRNQALDEALDKLCRITKRPAIMRVIPLPARLALRAVCAARNLMKTKRAAEEDGDEELAGRAKKQLIRMRRSNNETIARAVGAMRLWV